MHVLAIVCLSSLVISWEVPAFRGTAVSGSRLSPTFGCGCVPPCGSAPPCGCAPPCGPAPPWGCVPPCGCAPPCEWSEMQPRDLALTQDNDSSPSQLPLPSPWSEEEEAVATILESSPTLSLGHVDAASQTTLTDSVPARPSPAPLALTPSALSRFCRPCRRQCRLQRRCRSCLKS